MPTIRLSVTAVAPRERCFDLARSVDFHLASTPGTGEQVVGGRISGLLELGDTVTWRARHLGLWQELTSRITAFDRPRYFQDSQVRGAFRGFRHDHLFEPVPGDPLRTTLTEVFTFESPLGPLGRLADLAFLTAYMTRFLRLRLELLKDGAESSGWQDLLGLAPSPAAGPPTSPPTS